MSSSWLVAMAVRTFYLCFGVRGHERIIEGLHPFAQWRDVREVCLCWLRVCFFSCFSLCVVSYLLRPSVQASFSVG